MGEISVMDIDIKIGSVAINWRFGLTWSYGETALGPLSTFWEFDWSRFRNGWWWTVQPASQGALWGREIGAGALHAIIEVHR